VLYRQQILALWGMVVAGMLPLCLMTLGPVVVTHGGMSLPPWVTAYVRRTLRAHFWWPLPLCRKTVCPYRRGPRRQMYSFAKFLADYLFLQKRENIKKFHNTSFRRLLYMFRKMNKRGNYKAQEDPKQPT
jgi:hypothetical protein